MPEKHIVALEPLAPPDFSLFVKALQEAFSVTPREKFGNPDLVPSENDIRASFQTDGAQAFHILLNGERAGGAVVVIDEKTQRNSPDLFFISPGYHGKNAGLAAWKTFEARYPDTVIWETVTPLFQGAQHAFLREQMRFSYRGMFQPPPCRPERPHGESASPLDTFFRFEKIMK
ncbi:hypothetical protein NAI64_02110 [Oxalobacter sp. OxGP1]|uniref:hypothetical protein n=1 Tax=Oxalobacter paeniformigenes TaxID=2946594 RepID=UPI0022B022C6|nr:hypothetical protein [Oxalobacter paeniformigenes]MCZ4052516.1 hypothetical protein [Oxalobacter paeniformigenes]